jgi:LAS superfamily LD-carboxypeptidase LdcB
MMNDLELTGRARSHVVQRDDLHAALHREALQPFLALKEAAARDGIDIEIVSAFRDFDAQARIWNMKFHGERPLYDTDGSVRDHGSLTENELVDAILCWSAVPGASRHHWGSDIDVIDRAAMPDGYRVRLLPDESEPGGVFHELHRWLDANMARFGFFRPYAVYRGGMNCEPWHLSYAPVSVPALRQFTVDVFRETVAGSNISGKARVLACADEIFERYVANVAVPDGTVAHV